jgi:hypothetical protein
MTSEEFTNILHRDPLLTSKGRFTSSEACGPYYQMYRQELFEQYDEADAGEEFLKLCYQLESTRKEGQSTLTVTDYIQEWYSYHFRLNLSVSEGALLVAASYLKLLVDNNGESRVAIGVLPDILDEYWDIGAMRRLGVFVIG